MAKKTSKKTSKKSSTKATKKSPAPAAKSADASDRTRWGARDDLGSDTGAYIRTIPSELRPVAERLDARFRAAHPDIIGVIKWGMPVYTLRKVMLASIWKGKGYLRLGLYAGASIDDPKGLCAGEGKEHRHVRIHSEGDPAWADLEHLIVQSVERAITDAC